MPNWRHRRLMLRSGCRARVKNSCRSWDTVVSLQGMVRIPSVGTGEVLPMSSYGCYLCVRSVHWGAGEGVSAFQAAFKIAWKGSLKASGVSFGKAEAHEGSLKAVLNGFQKAAYRTKKVLFSRTSLL